MKAAGMIIALARLIALFTLLAASTGLLSHTDHVILRHVVFMVGLACAYWAYQVRRPAWIVAMLAVAAAFNPIVRFHPTLNGWIALDVVAAGVFAISFFSLNEPAARA
jgi:hypothetical protein